MKNKPTITYIKKDEKEKEIIINPLNKNKMLEELFEITYIKFKDQFLYKLKSDIEFIKLKNYKFDHNLKLETNTSISEEEKIIILENCLFKGEKNDFETDYLEIITPKFLNLSKININNTKDVNLTLDEKMKNLELRIRDCHKLTLNSSETLNLLQIYNVGNVYIKNLINLIETTSSYIVSNKLTLEDSIIKETNINSENINLKNSIIEDNRENYINTKLINLSNSLIISDDEIFLPNLRKIEFDDQVNLVPSYLEARTLIMLGKETYQNYNPIKPLRINPQLLNNDSKLVNQRLLHLLKKLRDKVNKNINIILTEEEQKLLQEINKYEMDQKKLLKQEVSNKKTIADSKLAEHKKHLLTKKITTYKK